MFATINPVAAPIVKCAVPFIMIPPCYEFYGILPNTTLYLSYNKTFVLFRGKFKFIGEILKVIGESRGTGNLSLCPLML
ncbi:hypothetical protein J6TS2_26000 [Heyndrickxia sporothermodurans]|nr:hypothetical protein J6TS2_26000 [Heyndrickxia sporothermodurans]